MFGEGPSAVPTLSDLPKLEYTEPVVQEALQLYPPANAPDHESIDDVRFDAYPIPAGSTIFTSQW